MLLDAIMLDAIMFVGKTGPGSAIWQLHLFAFSIISAGGSGVRATVPLFIVSLVHQFDPEQVPLSGATEWLGYWWVCAVLGVMLLLEVLADTIPAVANALHVVLTPIYPMAGALAAYAPDYGGGTFTHLVMAAVGGGLAFAFHSGKSATRLGAHGGSGGVCTPLQSTAGTAGLMSVMLAVIFFVILSVFIAIVVACLAVYAVVVLREASHQRRFGIREATMTARAAMRFNRLIRRQPATPSTAATPPGTTLVDASQAARQEPLVEPAPVPGPGPNDVSCC